MFQQILLCVVAFPFAAGCSKFDMLNATVPSCGYVRTNDLAYGSMPRQKLDVYRPRSAKGPVPTVIFFYGGDWQQGEKGDYCFAAEGITSRGFVAVMPNYRLHPDVVFPAFVEDAAMAVRWTRDNIARFGGDPSRIYLMGHSAGAHIAALLTLDKHYLENQGVNRNAILATAGLSGPYDFVPSAYDRAVFKMPEGGAPDALMEPIHFADGSAPPMLLLHGEDDDVVGFDNAVRLADRITRAGGDARYIGYPGKGHRAIVLSMAFAFRWISPVLDDTAAFFRGHAISSARESTSRRSSAPSD